MGDSEPTLQLDSLQPVLERVIDAVPQSLLGAAARRALLQTADALPGVLSRRSLGLELRLQGPRTGDLLVAAVPSASDGEALHRALTLEALGGEPATGRLAGALSEWRDPRSWLARSCTFLLLGLDASRAAEGEPAPPPCLYLAPRGANDADASDGAGANAFHADPFGLLSALAAVTGSPVDFDTCHDFKVLLEALPARAELFAASAMPSRDSRRAPRVAMRRFRAAELKPFLRAVGRKAAARTLTPLAKRLEPVSGNLCVVLELGPHAVDAVGLEVSTGGDWPLGDRAGWRALLDALVDLGLADEERAEAVLGLISNGGDDRAASGLSHVRLTAVGDTLAPTQICVGYEHPHRPPPPRLGSRPNRIGRSPE